MSSNSLYVLVRTVFTGGELSHTHVQQSDYVFEWDAPQNSSDSAPLNASSIKQHFKKIPLFYKILSPIYHSYWKIKKMKD